MSTSKINNIVMVIYAYRYNGKIKDLKTEKAEFRNFC